MPRNKNMNVGAVNSRTGSSEKHAINSGVGGDIPGLLPPIAPDTARPENPFREGGPIAKKSAFRPASSAESAEETKKRKKDAANAESIAKVVKRRRPKSEDVMKNRREKAQNIPSVTAEEQQAYKEKITPKEPTKRPDKDPLEMDTPYGEESAKPKPVKRAKPDTRIKATTDKGTIRNFVPENQKDFKYRSSVKDVPSATGRGGKPLAAGAKRRRRR